jgi:hypothetical protein
MNETSGKQAVTGTVSRSLFSRFLAWVRGPGDPPRPSNERLADVLSATYDSLPRLAEAFLLHARKAGLLFDLNERLQFHSTITFPDATIIFSYCDPGHRSTRALSVKSAERDFQLWFELANMVILESAGTRVYSHTRPDEAGRGGTAPSGDAAAFLDVAQFVSQLTPSKYGQPLRVE